MIFAEVNAVRIPKGSARKIREGDKVLWTPLVARYGRIDYTGGIISMNVNLDHIKQICRKPMKKVPKGLSEYGITTEEIEQMFLGFCKEDLRN